MSGATGAEAPAPPGAPSQARIAARAVARSAAASARSLAAHAATAGRALARFAAPVTGVVSTTGWLVLAAAAVSLVVAWAFGWIEFRDVATTDGIPIREREERLPRLPVLQRRR